MSHSLNNSADNLNSNVNRAAEHYAMLYQGRAFSGHERNCCFLNTLGGGPGDDRFATVSAISGLDVDDDGRALVQTDWDHDGDIDLWISNRNAPRLRLFRNDSGDTNKFLQLKLVGNGGDTNRDAFGARVRIVLKSSGESTAAEGGAASAAAADPQTIKTLRCGEGFVSQSSPWLHFGLGDAAEIEHVYVTWPNREQTTEDFGALAVDGRFVLTQGSGQAQSVAPRAGELALQPSATQVPPDDRIHRIPLIYPLETPELGYFGFDGKPHDIKLTNSQVTLINLWSTTCKPCLKELTEFVRRADELKAAGVRVVAISIDALEGQVSEPQAAAREMAQRLKIPFEVGMAAPPVIDDLRLMHDALITLDRPLPMPSSFLINRTGQLEVIYKGPVDVDTLLRDAQTQPRDVMERYVRAAAFPGRMIDDDVVNSSMIRNQATVHYKRAKQLVGLKMYDKAVREYESLLKYWPESGSMINDLGVLLSMRGDISAAETNFTKALKLKPNDPEIRYNLARTLEKRQDLSGAVQLMEESVARFPGHANSHFLLGVLKTRGKDFAAAKVSFERAIACKPKHGQALFALASLLLSEGNFTAAKSHLRMALEVTPNEPVIMAALGKVYVQERNWTDAESILRQAVRLQPQLIEAQFQLGLALAAQNKFTEAQYHFEIVLRLDGNHAGAREALQKMLRGSVSRN